MILNVVFWFWSVFARAISVRLIGENSTRRISGLIGLALLKTSSPAVPKIPGADTGRIDRDEPEVPRSAVSDSPLERPTRESEHGHAITASSKPSVPSPIQVSSDQMGTRIVINAVTLAASDREAPVLYLEGDTRMRIGEATVNQSPISPPSPTKLDDGAQLLRFEAATEGGDLEVTLEF
ncbi:hypothetical protein NUW54_g8951 [Trametes sanguinea]|uniref:Uncharacterized protein n=1 Tax=Trametes sanguinea TaxID=158606 RepID=A0ACC1PAZ4_9APHY|nr:hypothetical protein NUW54_g8951 [Trametes sanguinea]